MNISKITFKGSFNVDNNKKHDVKYITIGINSTSDFQNNQDVVMIINSEKQYISYDVTPNDLKNHLKNKNNFDGRSFFGYKNILKSHLENSNNKYQTIKNLNILLNAKNHSLDAQQIVYILKSYESKTPTTLMKMFNNNINDISENMIDLALDSYDEEQKIKRKFNSFNNKNNYGLLSGYIENKINENQE